MRALDCIAQLRLQSWCIGAGAIRGLVWDHLHGFAEHSWLGDVDMVYFDASESPQHSEMALQNSLQRMAPDLPWEVTNQATVHHWYEREFGIKVEPLGSLEEGVASWPEYATCVGVTLDPNKRVRVIAPWGLDDLFNLRVRHNPVRASVKDYRKRMVEKNFSSRWPSVIVEA
ncbi:MAG: hypothetical protein C4K60_18965 [Ideonella sp. MAG2]|nr:MAG: hypothetical protein C4K60_18965 [Ideonella sp. MAG2]